MSSEVGTGHTGWSDCASTAYASLGLATQGSSAVRVVQGGCPLGPWGLGGDAAGALGGGGRRRCGNSSTCLKEATCRGWGAGGVTISYGCGMDVSLSGPGGHMRFLKSGRRQHGKAMMGKASGGRDRGTAPVLDDKQSSKCDDGTETAHFGFGVTAYGGGCGRCSRRGASGCCCCHGPGGSPLG